MLIPRLGIVGAAIASVVAYTVSAAILATAFVRLTGADARALVPGPADAAAVIRFLRTDPSRQRAVTAAARDGQPARGPFAPTCR